MATATNADAGFLPRRMPRVLRILVIAQIFTAFLTGTKLIPGIRNNFGPFEILGSLVFVAFFLSPRRRHPLRFHPVSRVILVITVAAVISLTQLPPERLRLGVVQTLILIFMFLFVLVLYNLMLEYQIGPQRLLRLVTYAALVIGPWVFFAGVSAGGDIQAAGPFRNRAHMANYMLTAFWLVLLYNFWPGISKRERWVSYLGLASSLYPIAASGRRSVYLSLIVGLVGVFCVLLTANPGRRATAFKAAAAILGILGLLYVGGQWIPQLEFFKARVEGIGARLEMASETANSDFASDNNFFQLQRAGVWRAFLDRPILGIGWGGFFRSEYSPTGHEVHSTPMRFLAELGVIGLTLYLILMGMLLFGSVRVLARVRAGPYRLPALILCVAIWSLSISYVYNRHITERTFWLLLAVYLSFEAFAVSLERQVAAGRAVAAIPVRAVAGAYRKVAGTAESADRPATARRNLFRSLPGSTAGGSAAPRAGRR